MIHVILNPASRSGKGQKLWEKIQRVLVDHDVEFQPHFTKQSGSATKFARELTKDLGDNEKVSLLVIGGDGTLDEVLQGVKDYDYSKVTISYVPGGSGNDFARDYPPSGKTIEKLIHLLETPTKYVVDLGKAEMLLDDGKKHVHYFPVSAGMGFDAAVCAGVDGTGMKRFLNKIGLGKFVYLYIAVREVFFSKHPPCRLTLSDGTTHLFNHLLFAAFMNHRFEGGGFMFGPEADATDGMIDLCLPNIRNGFKVLRIIPSAYKGTHVRFKDIHMFRDSSFRIQSDIPLFVHCDGEVPGKSKDMRITCIPKALTVYM